MNRTLIIATTALTTSLLYPLSAGAQGPAFGGRGGARSSAPAGAAHVQGGSTAGLQQLPRMESRVQPVPRAATPPQGMALREPIPSIRSRQTPAGLRAPIAGARSFRTPGRQQPTIAFGGTTVRNMSQNDPVRSEARSAAVVAGSGMRTRVPGDVSRNWTRGQMHAWNHHRYRWVNNNWVVFDGGYYGGGYYGSPYGGGSGFYDGAGYGGDTEAVYSPQESSAYMSSDSLAGSVQEALLRQGYNPGAVDGVIGSQTRNAIAQFQTDHRLPVTGRIDRTLISALSL